MPFSIRKSGSKFEVITTATGKVHGTFDSRQAADGQLRALYANVPEATEAAGTKQPAKRKKPE